MSRRNHKTKYQPKMVRTVYLLSVILLAASSRVGAQDVQIVIGDGSGPPGGTASVPFTLTDATDTAVGAGLFVLFPGGTQDALSIDLPSGCTIAQRLNDTHILAAVRLNRPPGGQGFDLEVAPKPDAPGSPDLPIGTGDIATCTFTISQAAALGSSTTLTADSAQINDKNAQVFPAQGVNGEVSVALQTPTATATNTPTPTSVPTNTPTATRTTPPTNTPTSVPPTLTSTPTATRTNTPSSPTPTRTTGTGGGGGGGGGCTIAAPGNVDAGPFTWLLIPAALLLWRRARA